MSSFKTVQINEVQTNESSSKMINVLNYK